MLAELEVTSADLGRLDLDVEVLQGGHPRLEPQRLSRRDVGGFVQHSGRAAQDNRPGLLGEDAVRLEQHLGVDGQFREFVARGRPEVKLPAAHGVVDREDIGFAAHDHHQPAVLGALNQLPALIVGEYEDGVVVWMFEDHGFIVLAGVQKRQGLCGEIGVTRSTYAVVRAVNRAAVDNLDAQNVMSVTLKALFGCTRLDFLSGGNS